MTGPVGDEMTAIWAAADPERPNRAKNASKRRNFIAPSIRPSRRSREPLHRFHAQGPDRARHAVPAKLLHRLVPRDHGGYRRRSRRGFRLVETGDRRAGPEAHQGT